MELQRGAVAHERETSSSASRTGRLAPRAPATWWGGYRRLGYVGHDLNRDTHAAKRLTGFKAALAETGLAFADCKVAALPSSIEVGRAGLERILARTPDLDAVDCSNDDTAIGGYFLGLARGIAIPSHLRSATMGSRSPGWRRPPLATIRMPRVLGGETAVRLALRDAPARVVDVDFS